MNNDGTSRNDRGQCGGDDFLSLADLVRMVWRHRLMIIVITVIAALVAGIPAMLKPRPWQASCLMEVMPEYTRDGRVDRDLFDTTIMTHLEAAKSPMIAMRVLQRKDKPAQGLSLSSLTRKLKVSRPPKTSTIECKISLADREDALFYAGAWREECLREITRRAMEKSLLFARGRLRDTQEDWLKHTAAVDEARKNAERLANDRLISVSRSVDDVVLWQDLVKKSDAESVSRMTNLYLKTEEINHEYLNAKNRLAAAGEQAAGAIKSRAFYTHLVRELDAKLSRENGESTAPVPGQETPEEKIDDVENDAREYVESLMKAREVIALGEPVVYPGSSGASKKIGVAVLGALVIGCAISFLWEWGKQLHLE